jgi:hypothetical protein
MSNTNNQAEVSIKVIQFSGKREDFKPWFEKFKARGKRRGYKDHYLKKAGDIPITTYDIDNDTSTSDDEKKALQKLKEENENAFHELLLLMDTSTVEGKLAFKLVMSSKTTDYEDGHAGNSVEKLIKKFMPKTAPTLVKLHKEFYSSSITKLSPGSDPDVWMTELERIRLRMEEMGSQMSDNQFIVHVVNNLTPEYDVVVDVNNSRIDLSTNPLTIDEL